MFHRLIGVLLAVLVLVGMAGQARAENVLVNGDFSNGDHGWRLQITSGGESHGATIAVRERTLHLQRPEGSFLVRAYQDVDAVPGDVFQMRCEVNVIRAPWAHPVMSVMAIDEAGEVIENFRSERYDRGTDGWQPVAGELRVPPGTVRLRVNLRPTQRDVEVFYRQVRLIRTVSGARVHSQMDEARTIPVVSHAVAIQESFDPSQWADALQLTGFSLLGDPQRRVIQQTQVYLQFHDNDLYVAYRMAEPHPGNMQRLYDAAADRFYLDDTAQMFISFDTLSTTQVMVNANGAYALRSHGSTFGVSSYRRHWHHIPQSTTGNLQEIEAASEVRADEWIGRFRINFDTLKADHDGRGALTHLFVNFARHRPNSDEVYSTWAAVPGESLLNTQTFQPLRLPDAVRETAGTTADEPMDYELTRRFDLDALLIAGKPVHLELGEGRIALPGQVIFETRNVTLEPVVKAIVERALVKPSATSTLTITSEVVADASGLDLAVRTVLTASDEAFSVTMNAEGIHVTSLNRDGVLRGLATVSLMAMSARHQAAGALPHVEIHDQPGLAVRGYMLTPSSGEGPDEMKQMLEILFLLRYNMFMWTLSSYGLRTDFPFESHPTLSSGKYTRQQWADFADHARALGIRLVPNFYSWGRVPFILNNARYAHLAENPAETDRGLYFRNRRVDRNMAVAHPASYELLKELWGEIIDTMKLQDFHIGQDEVNFDAMNTHPLSAERGWRNVDWFIESTRLSAEYFDERGVRLWIWGDMIDPDHNARGSGQPGDPLYRPGLEVYGPDLLAKLPPSVHIMDWKYDGSFDHSDAYPSIAMFAENGFRVVGASKYAANNVAGMVREVARYERGLGTIATTWNDGIVHRESGFIDSMLDEVVNAMALQAYLAWSPDQSHLNDFPYPPGLLYHHARNIVVGTPGRAREVRPLTVGNAVLTGGQALAELLALPQNGELAFLREPVVNYRGVELTVFRQAGRVAAVGVEGRKGQAVSLDVSPFQARRLTFLHTINKQNVDPLLRAHRRYQNYPEDTLCAIYVIRYTDGVEVEVPVRYLTMLNDWNAPEIPTKADPCVFGVLNDRYQVNMPTLTWENPRPDVAIAQITVRSGNHANISHALLAVSVE